MDKSNKELAVDLAKSVLQCMSNNQSPLHKPISGDDIKNVLKDCYSAICDLDNGM